MHSSASTFNQVTISILYYHLNYAYEANHQSFIPFGKYSTTKYTHTSIYPPNLSYQNEIFKRISVKVKVFKFHLGCISSILLDLPNGALIDVELID